MKKKKPDKKAVAIARLIENVADAGGPMEAAKVVDDRAYRRGVKDGKRAQRAEDLTVTLIVSGAAALLAQIPHLLVFLHRRKAEKEAKAKEEAERLESVRRDLEKKLRDEGL